MDPHTFRSDIGVDVYWRRRMAALVGVLVVVAVVAWACSSGGPDETPKPQAQLGGSLTPDPLVTVLPTVTVTPSPSPSPPRRAAKAAARAKRPGDACDAPDLVLNMQGQGDVYAPGSRPRFLLTLVNIGKVMCTADVGPRAMEVRITSGSDRVWSSADCVSGVTDDIRRLDRGIPYVREVEWDRRRSGGDCTAKRDGAEAGTYVAVVRSPGLKSRRAVFHLR
ncbi:hypothetical protein OHA77_22130 [Streptosporangium sp. NBC_01639]|uniref:hypothetical protein n=1 Tax=unclassified Streptosporangium TaxID=2632669 RepID=UPI002DD975A9|nr:hypothetical protein [Streptosporangium sp. NBC_01756]WSC89986.1 hypothetical protein OIE48_17920 [Streptosporangium sp. NBC_01756]WTD51385.1 hypothetical protein OHA77_22130 [Streptosporangium sp. NBC_01639]